MTNFATRLAQVVSRWRLLDSKFRHNKGQYALQTLMAMATIMAVLLVLDEVDQTVLIASLGASTFIAFSMPRSYPSKPRYMIGGYLVGTAVGCLLSMLSPPLASQAALDPRVAQIICGAVATGLSFFLMVLTDTEHPPGAALALGYVLNEWDLGTVMVVVGGVTALAAITHLFRKQMMDLL